MNGLFDAVKGMEDGGHTLVFAIVVKPNGREYQCMLHGGVSPGEIRKALRASADEIWLRESLDGVGERG